MMAQRYGAQNILKNQIKIQSDACLQPQHIFHMERKPQIHQIQTS